MIQSCDSNLLFHALVPSDSLHGRASAYLNSLAGSEDFLICELALTELYTLLRNPKACQSPLSAREAVNVIQALCANPHWRLVDYPGELMPKVWKAAARHDFARTGVYDARLALTLRHYGVTHFATRDVKHFQGYGFEKVFDPCLK